MPDDLRAQIQPLLRCRGGDGRAAAARAGRRGGRCDRHAREASGRRGLQSADLHRRQGHGATGGTERRIAQHHEQHAPRPHRREGEVRCVSRADRRLPGAGRRQLRQYSRRHRRGPEDRGEMAEPVSDARCPDCARRRHQRQGGRKSAQRTADAGAVAQARHHRHRRWRSRSAPNSSVAGAPDVAAAARAVHAHGTARAAQVAWGRKRRPTRRTAPPSVDVVIAGGRDGPAASQIAAAVAVVSTPCAARLPHA